MLRLRRLFWFQELGDLVLDFRAVITVLRGTLIIIRTGTIGTRTPTTIRMPGIHIHIIPHPQDIGTVGIGLTTVTTTIITIVTKLR